MAITKKAKVSTAQSRINSKPLKPTQSSAQGNPHSRSQFDQTNYSIHTKKVVWIETLSFACIWISFMLGLVFVVYLRNTVNDIGLVMNFIIGGIIFFSFIPFFMNWSYYNALWKGWKNGKEIIYKELEKKSEGSLFGNREIWIKN
ncbi:MAG: hypothetical protein AB1391_03685 [Candidatus Micrarchaeota archaeon]